LEGPFSTPESASSIVDEDEEADQDAYKNTKGDLGSRITVTSPGKRQKTTLDNSVRAEEGQEKEEGRNPAYKHCGRILIHPYHSYKIEGLCLRCLTRRDTLLANFELNAIRDTVYRESMSGPGHKNRRFASSSLCAEGDLGGKCGIGGDQELKLLSVQLKQPMAMPMPKPSLLQNVHLQVGMARVEEQQQQTPWRLTLPPAEVPRNGWGLAGMRDGEWI